MHEMQACDQKLKILNTNIAYCRTLEQTAFKITLSTKFFWNYIHSKYPHKPNDLNKLRWALSVPRHPKRIVPGKLKVCCNWHIARALPLKQKMHLKSKPLKLPDCICDLRWVSHLQHFCNFSSGKQIPAGRALRVMWIFVVRRMHPCGAWAPGRAQKIDLKAHQKALFPKICSISESWKIFAPLGISPKE